MRKLVPIIALWCLVGCGTGSNTPLTPYDIIIDHHAGTVSPANILRKKDGEIVKVHITHTNLDCFEFNAVTIDVPNDQNRSARAARTGFPDDVDFEMLYDGTPTRLQVSAIKRADATDCTGLSERRTGGGLPPWEILIKTDGWDLAFAGAFTADGLTNPVFEAVPATRATTGGATEQGVKVREVPNGRDEARLGAAATVHLYHSDPEKLGAWSVNWVPVSFGLGVGERSQTRYYLGTGLKFDRKLFLTLGMALGAVQTRPTGLDENGFTTNTNILSNLPTRTERTWFAGLSYTFAGVGPDAFKGPFAPVAPPPQVPSGAAAETTNGGGNNDAAALKVENVTKGENAKYELKVTNRNDAKKTFELKHNLPTNATAMTWRCEASAGGTCPGTSATTEQTGAIAASFELDPQGTLRFKVSTTFPAGKVENGKAELSGGATESRDIILK